MPKEILDSKDTPVSVKTLLALEERMNKSSFTLCDITNVSVEDLHLLKMGLEFLGALKGSLQDIRKSIDNLKKKGAE